MPSDALVREQLVNFLRGGNAHITVKTAFENFPPAFFNEKPLRLFFSAWQLLEHMRITQWDILEFIRNPNHNSPEWPGGYWPAENQKADEEKWQHTLSQFTSDLDELEQLVKNPNTALYSPLPHARSYTILREILLVGDHNAYHLGQMIMLRRLLNIWE